MFAAPNPSALQTESDVEQKLAWPLLTEHRPHGLAFPAAEVSTKPDIRAFTIGKGTSAKLYYPDYVVTVLALPVLIVEAKKPGADLKTAADEARLYATELNARYPAGVNPCKFCVVTDGITTQLRSWDSDEAAVQFTLDDIGPVSPKFGEFLRMLDADALRAHAVRVHKAVKPPRHFRALSLVGGQTVQSEQIEFNDFGRVLAANFQTIFDPASYEDRLKIVRNAYVGSPRKERYLSEIDRIIRNATPLLANQTQLIEDPASPTEISHRFQDLTSLRNRVLLLVGSVGAGKSTFVDYVRDRGLPQTILNQTAWVRIDLNPAPVTAEEIYPWLRKHIAEGIRATSPDINTHSIENLKTLYKAKVREFDEGEGSLFPKDSEAYASRLADLLAVLKRDELLTIRCLEQYLCTGRGRLLIIVLDNCDKRDRDEQLLMFQVAKYIQQEVRCLVILPLRHETFENHQHEPPLDTALKDLVYRIEPPSFQAVLKRRLGFVVNEARRIGPRCLSYSLGSKTIEFPVEKLERFLHAMMGALFDHRHFGRKIIVGLAGWNIRRAFEIFLEFCRSGYIKESDIFEMQVSTGELASLPHGVVAKVLLRTNRRYYDGNTSFVKNLFQLDPAGPTSCPLVRYWILAWLRANASVTGPSGIKGFHRFSDILRDLLVVGTDPETVRKEFRYLAKAGCILLEHLRVDNLKDGDLVRITPSGHVHLELAHRDINYLAACSEDTWVAEEHLAEQIRSRISQQPYWRGLSWGNTLANAADFARYLEAQQGAVLRTVPYLPDSNINVAKVDFDRILAEVNSHQQRFSNQRAQQSHNAR